MADHGNILAQVMGMAMNPTLIAVGVGFGLALRRPAAALWAAAVVFAGTLGLWAVMGGIGYAFSGADGQANAPGRGFWMGGVALGAGSAAITAVYGFVTQWLATRFWPGDEGRRAEISNEGEA